MYINISSPDFPLTQSIKGNVSKKMQKIFELNNQVRSIAVSFKKEGKLFLVVIRANINGLNAPTVIRERGDKFYSALSNARSRLKNKVVEFKGKRKSRHGSKQYSLAESLI